MKTPAHRILSVKISQIDYQSTLDEIKKLVVKKKSNYICVAAVHLVVECQHDPKLLTGVNRSALTIPDGMPLVWLSKLAGFNQTSRVYGPTLTLKICQLADQKKWRMFLLGGASGQSQQLAKILKRNYPHINIIGQVDTPIRPIPREKNKLLLDDINHLKPDIILVGLGCPLQEKWMIENAPRIKRGVLIGVGAAFDFITQTKKQAPLCVQQSGFEWLFRLVQEPTRLGKRYTITNLDFIFRLLRSFY